MRTMLLAVLAVTCVPAFAREPASDAGRVKAGRATGPRLYRLKLDGEQCLELAEIAAEAEDLRVGYEAAERRLLPRLREAIEQLRDEVERDRGLDPATTKAASGTDKLLKHARKEFFDSMKPLEERALAVLTPEQRARFARKPKQPKSDVERLRTELREIHANQYGSLGRIGRWLLTPGLSQALTAKATGRRAARPPRPLDSDLMKLRKRVQATRREINLWNLMNGLHLEPAQLCTLGREARPGGSVESVLAALSAEQLDVLHGYKACLVPPRNLRDPVRAGQANDNTAGVRMLERFRRVPAKLWPSTGERLVNFALDRIEKSQGEYGTDERLACFALLSLTVEEARALDDAAFRMRAEELAARIEPIFRKRALEEELKQATGADALIREKARRFLMDPAIAPLCEKRARQLAHPDPIVPEGPIEKAERCGAGECGRP